MDKIEREGQVAVLVSPGFGAGWSTWADEEHRGTLCMDADIVQAVIDGDIPKAISIAEEKCPGIYTGGGSDLVVKWVPKGRAYEIREYDGSESLHIIGSENYLIA